MSDSELFNRRVAVTIASVKDGAFFGEKTNAVVIRDMRVKFKIEKTLGEDPNTGEIEIFNLSDITRGLLQKLPLHARLDAGYADPSGGSTELSRLFTGDLTYSASKRDGNVTWITTLTLGEGANAYKSARVNHSAAAGTNPKAAVAEIAKSMGLSMPTNIADAKELAGQFVSGHSMTGPSRVQMTKALKSRGYGWSVQNDELQILKDGTGVRADTAILVAQRTGMLGSPEMGAPKSKKETPSLTVKMRLYPGLTPGGRIKVESEKINGIFRISRVVHTGDTRGPEWYSEIEAKVL